MSLARKSDVRCTVCEHAVPPQGDHTKQRMTVRHLHLDGSCSNNDPHNDASHTERGTYLERPHICKLQCHQNRVLSIQSGAALVLDDVWMPQPL